jgi:endoglucanase
MRKYHLAAISVLASLGLLSCLTSLAVDGRKYPAVIIEQNVDGKGIAGTHGQLQLMGANLCDSKGNAVQLKGVSSHGRQWFPQYANEKVIKWLRDDWKADVFRAAMYTEGGDTNGYIGNPQVKQKVIQSVEAAVKLGVYVIIDWHILHDNNPKTYQKQAIEFFSEMAQKYGQYPNVIFELCNEPNGNNVTWENDIKPYAEAVIPVIRKYAPDNIIIVGTPQWSQRVNDAAEDPILGHKNIMYALHFYSGTHTGWLRNAASDAIGTGIPVFVTEFGTTDASGDGNVDINETQRWFTFLKEKNISWVNWSLANKNESSAILKAGKDAAGNGNWKEADLSESGAFIRVVMRGEIEITNPDYED